MFQGGIPSRIGLPQIRNYSVVCRSAVSGLFLPNGAVMLNCSLSLEPGYTQVSHVGQEETSSYLLKAGEADIQSRFVGRAFRGMCGRGDTPRIMHAMRRKLVNSGNDRVPHSNDKPAKMRKYSDKTLKILFGFCGNRCAEPTCTNLIIADATPYSVEAVIGQIAHIYASSDQGPRGKAGLTKAERDAPDNLVLLCPTHHVVVDKQHETYPAALLIDWKEKRERPYREGIKDRINDLGFKELEFAATSLLAADAPDSSDYGNIPPADKIAKNGLGSTSATLLRMGAAKSRECETVITKASQLQPEFADRLRLGFVTQYNLLRSKGLAGDDLFMAMYIWASGVNGGKVREAAGLCLLSHLFIVCDVFEK